MKENQIADMSFEQYSNLYEEIERKNILLWDQEEENRVLRCRVSELQAIITNKDKSIDDLERWCKVLQSGWDHEKLNRQIEELEIVNKHFQMALIQEQEKRTNGLEMLCKHLQFELDTERNLKIAELEKNLEEKNRKIIELEEWCVQLQNWLDQEKKRNVLRRIGRRIKNAFTRK